MTAFPLSVLPEVSIPEIIIFMARRGIGNIVVSNDDMVGIVTARDLVDAYCRHVKDLLSAE